jgi:hypothetical protein
MLLRVEVAVAAFAAVAIGALWLSARNATTVCVLEVTAGNVVVRWGGLAPRILADIGDVASHPAIARATLRIVREGGRAVLHVRGAVSPEQMQQLRNVIGSVPLAKLANARRRR